MDRRHLLTAGLAGATAMAGPSLARAAVERSKVELKPGLAFVFRATITLSPPLELGTFDGQRKRMVPITGGSVDGPRFKGVILPGGADWQTLRVGDGNTQIYARYTLRHEDGTLVSIVNPGVRRGPPDVMARLAAGETVDPALYYFRSSPQFDVQPGPHGWLVENTFVGVGKRWPDAVDLDVYQVL